MTSRINTNAFFDVTDVQVPFDSAQLRKHGTFFNTQLFVHSLSVLNDQYVLVADVYVKSVFIIHVGGTRCVPSSTDNIMKIRARITWTVEFIRTCIFIF